MTRKIPQTRSDTADRILDEAERLIQTRGYTAFSYQDIADTLEIRKASIHYHFATKAELGLAVIERYTRNFGLILDTIIEDPDRTGMEMLGRYFMPYMQFAQTDDQVCLCGAVAGEMLVLPALLRAGVDRFFTQHQAWLTRILSRGLERGDFAFSAEPEKMARLVFGALQGALLVKRTTGNASQMGDVIAALISELSPTAGRSGDRS